METETKILPRGMRDRILTERSLKVDTIDIACLLNRINNDKSTAGNLDLQAAAMHLEVAMRKINNYNVNVAERLLKTTAL